jgi:outer membrane lipoprotein LolB
MWFARVWVVGVVGLAGCATAPPVTDVAVLKERQGRFSVQSTVPMQQTEAVQGAFVWRRLATGWQLDLNSPLGATLARLTVTPEGARLQQPDAPERRAASARDLLANVLGAPVPVDALEDWVDGRLQTNAAVTEVKRDDLGRVVSFRQDAWRVRFARYGQDGPGRIDVSGHQQGQDIELRLVVEQPA